MTGLASFMEISRRPLRGTALSAVLCQCQGMMQPGVNFISTTEGPLPGSPRRTARVAQSGTPGSGAYFWEEALLTTVVSEASWAEMVAAKSVARRSENSSVFMSASVGFEGTVVFLRKECQ